MVSLSRPSRLGVLLPGNCRWCPFHEPFTDLFGRSFAGTAGREGGRVPAAAVPVDLNFVVRAPRLFAELLGKLLFWCGEDKIVYGYPQLTEQAKRKILGENLLRLHGMDVEAIKAKLAS